MMQYVFIEFFHKNHIKYRMVKFQPSNHKVKKYHAAWNSENLVRFCLKKVYFVALVNATRVKNKKGMPLTG